MAHRHEPETAPFGMWESPLDLHVLFEGPAIPRFPSSDNGHVYWLQEQPAEGGRTVLMGRDIEGVERCFTPPGFSVRSRVHEYGGRSYLVADGCCYFVNDHDQRIYRQGLSSSEIPQAVTGTAADGQLRYVDLSIDPLREFLLCIVETDYSDRENDNALAIVPLNAALPAMPVLIAEGHDFYANAIIDSAGHQIAWLQWDHPYMPWDQNQAVLGALRRQREGAVISEPRVVAGGEHTAVCQLAFDGDDRLLLAIDQPADRSHPQRNFWNLYRCQSQRLEAVTQDLDGEYGWPHWVFGDSRYVDLGNKIVAAKTGRDGDQLVLVKQGVMNTVYRDAVSLSQLWKADDGGVLFVESGAGFGPRLSCWRDNGVTTIKQASELLAPESLSVARSITFPTCDGNEAHGFFYPPKNSGYLPEPGTLPPLLTLVHGGPTARSLPGLDYSRQYWTSLGFAVLDVNHRGSTGYGREYRQTLLGHWGEYDCDDVVSAIQYVTAQGWADVDRVFIRGKSAGGYAVLCALTRYPEQFAGGACYYGIGNLATLADQTHKFERCYTDRLIGEAYDPDKARNQRSQYYRRSPLNFVSSIRCPVIIFQGLDDQVVPPSVSREIAAALRSSGVEFEYVEYANEGHGFRASKTNIDALSRETAFYRKILANR